MDTLHRTSQDTGTAVSFTLGTLLPEGVDPEALARCEEDERLARANGFAPKPPIYSMGRLVNATGVSNFKKSYKEFDSLGRPQEVLAPFINRVLLERRQDVQTQVKDLRMLENGSLTRGGATLLPTTDSLDQLLRRTKCEEPGAAARYLALIPPTRRANEVNHWLAEAEGLAVLRTRNNLSVTGGNGKQVYAIVSPKYTPMDVDALAKLCLQETLFPGDCRAVVEYDGLKVRIELKWHSNIQPETCAAGEIFRAVAGISSSDDGTMSLTPFAGLDRNLCLNLIILDQSRMDLGKRRHTGRGLGLDIANGLKEAVDRVRVFAKKWDIGHTQKLSEIVRDSPEGVTTENMVKGVFLGLMKEGRLQLPGVRRTQAVEEFFRAFEKEPVPTRTGLVNAITRAAHEVPLNSPWGTSQVEQDGAKLLMSDRHLTWMNSEKEEAF